MRPRCFSLPAGGDLGYCARPTPGGAVRTAHSSSGGPSKPSLRFSLKWLQFVVVVIFVFPMSNLKLLCHMTFASSSGSSVSNTVAQSQKGLQHISSSWYKKKFAYGATWWRKKAVFHRYEFALFCFASLWLVSWFCLSADRGNFFSTPLALSTHRLVLRIKQDSRCVKREIRKHNTQNYLVHIPYMYLLET